MKNRAVVCIGLACGVLGWAFLCPVSAEEGGLAEALFQDEPAAHALYDKMVETMRKAESLYYEADYWMESRGLKLRETKYRIWLKAYIDALTTVHVDHQKLNSKLSGFSGRGK